MNFSINAASRVKPIFSASSNTNGNSFAEGSEQ